MTLLVTGGCGFIGTHFVRKWLRTNDELLVNVDKLSYSSNLHTAELISPNYKFIKLDICQTEKLREVIYQFRPRAIVHIAAETHVDESILHPARFISSNINGTASILEVSRVYLDRLSRDEKMKFRLINVSTDEVYGSLSENVSPFDEESPLNPSSPYSASKAAADLLALSYFKTYDFPVIISRCSNNYGSWQHAEKLIPKVVKALCNRTEIPIYGEGRQIREWIYVEDHVDALLAILSKGNPGSIFNIGSGYELENLNLVSMILAIAGPLVGDHQNRLSSLIRMVDDRPAHDFRYALDSSRIRKELGWSPKWSFADGLNETVTALISEI